MAKKAPKTSASEETQAAYRKLAETAPLVVSEGEWKETIIEAVYWPKEGAYGCGISSIWTTCLVGSLPYPSFIASRRGRGLLW